MQFAESSSTRRKIAAAREPRMLKPFEANHMWRHLRQKCCYHNSSFRASLIILRPLGELRWRLADTCDAAQDLPRQPLGHKVLPGNCRRISYRFPSVLLRCPAVFNIALRCPALPIELSMVLDGDFNISPTDRRRF